MKPACQRFFDLLFVAIVMMTVPFSSVTAAPQSPPGALYLGVIGDQPVVACVDNLAGEGSFYFADLRNDREPTQAAAFKTRSLTRSKIAPQNRWVEVQSGSGESAPDAREPVDESYRSWWQFSSASDLKLTGTRHFLKSDAGQERAEFVLSRTQSDCAKFEYARLNLPWKDVVGGRVKIGDYSFQKTIHPATEVTSFRLLRGPNKAVTAAINRAVKVREDSFLESWVDCREFDAQLRPLLLTNAVVTIQASDSSYCGGAHSNETSSLVIFDATTGALIDFDRWLSPRYQGVKGALKALVAEAVVDSGAEASCAERIKDIDWNAFTLWMAPDAMQFRFHEGARSLIHCKDDYAVPFNAVRRFIDAKHRIRFGQLRKRVEAQSALKEKLDAAYR